jgi:hypothetical protein
MGAAIRMVAASQVSGDGRHTSPWLLDVAAAFAPGLPAGPNGPLSCFPLLRTCDETFKREPSEAP